MATKKKQASGGARLAASGKKPIMLGVPPETHDLFRAAADLEHRTITQFLTHYGEIAAKRILGKNGK